MILYYIYKNKRKGVGSNFEVEESFANSKKDLEMNMNFDKNMIDNEKKGAKSNPEIDESVVNTKIDLEMIMKLDKNMIDNEKKLEENVPTPQKDVEDN